MLRLQKLHARSRHSDGHDLPRVGLVRRGRMRMVPLAPQAPGHRRGPPRGHRGVRRGQQPHHAGQPNPAVAPQPQIPNVAGTYQGPLTITASLEGVVLVTLSGTMHLTVVQAGAQLTITGSVSIFDETSALEAVTGTVDDTGRVTFPPDSLVNAVPIPHGRRPLRHPHPGAHHADVTRAPRRACLQTATSDDCPLRSWAR